MKKLTTILFFCFLSLLTTVQAQENVLSTEDQQKLITSINDLLISDYVFPEVAKEMAEMLNRNLAQGKYSNIASHAELASTITKDLQSISKDKHLRLILNPNQNGNPNSGGNPGNMGGQMQMMKDNNYGFKEVSILDGNIGYINLTNFFPSEFAGEAARKAMEQLKSTEAIIFDLRSNGGGSPTMIQLLSSYFFDKPVHLNTFYFKPTDSYDETWTEELDASKKMVDVPVYILTSKKTFSAAEEFTYNLKNLKRATIIGETTGGGAHPGGAKAVSDKFMLWVPFGRAINPITKTNWEGTGVIPDIKVSADTALEKALEIANSKK